MRKDKHRDVARGVLPSTARKGARDNKRNFHAKNRHAQRQATHAIERSLATVSAHGTVVHDPDLYDDFEARDVIDGYHASTKPDGSSYDHDMPTIVQDRRNADNLGPLFSWAEGVERQKMQGWSNDDKYQYFKAVLPDTLQGRHALGHVEQHLDLSNDEFNRIRYFVRHDSRKSLERFRAALAKCLATSKGRAALRTFIHETVPVAAHQIPSNNLTRIITEPAVDESGNRRFRTYTDINGTTRTAVIYVDVRVPQMIAVTCDDCAFLRNDPLINSEAVNRFISIVWNRPAKGLFPGWLDWHERRQSDYTHHPYKRKIIDYVFDFAQR